jgi:hypothetical protein
LPNKRYAFSRNLSYPTASGTAFPVSHIPVISVLRTIGYSAGACLLRIYRTVTRSGTFPRLSDGTGERPFPKVSNGHKSRVLPRGYLTAPGTHLPRRYRTVVTGGELSPELSRGTREPHSPYVRRPVIYLSLTSGFPELYSAFRPPTSGTQTFSHSITGWTQAAVRSAPTVQTPKSDCSGCTRDRTD